MTNLWQDLRYGVRVLAKNPGFALIAVLTLAIGIGANTAMFSVVNAVLLRPLAYKDSDRIVTLSSLWKQTGQHGQVSAPDFRDWHDQSSAFDSMAYYWDTDCAALSGNTAQFSHCGFAGPDFFRVFLVDPAAGHFFTPDEQKAGAAVISYSYWQQRFGGSAGAVGQSLRLFDRSLQIVGVAPPGFRFPNDTDIWIPTNSVFPDRESRSAHNYRVVARLEPGVTVSEAQAQMTTIAARLETEYPDSNAKKSAAVVPMRDEMVRDIRPTLYLLLGAVCVVMLIACANIANLLLARATGRSREVAIRAAMGANRSRVVRQMLTESALLAFAAGVVGVLIAFGGAGALVRLAPSDIPRVGEIGVDFRVLAFTFAVCAISTMIFGVAPALHASRIDLNEALQQSGSRGASSRGARRLHAILVVSEVALSVVLLAGAGLLIRSLDALLKVELGYRPEKIVVMETDVPASGLESSIRATELYNKLLAEAAAIPGVESVTATRGLPGQPSSDGGYWIDHLPPIEQLSFSAPEAVFSLVAPNYFGTMGIPLVAGRDFGGRDVHQSPHTVIINREFAKQAFPNQNPIGHLVFCGFDFDSLAGMTIVGVVGDVRQFGPATAPWPEIYMPYEQHPEPATAMTLVVRTPLAPGAVEESLKRTLGALSPDVPTRFSTMEAKLSESVAAPRFRALLVAAFATLALVLAMAGIYGVMAYSVAQRTREIGIRMALGAQRGGVLQLVLGQGFRMVVLGLALGLAGAFAATRVLASLLFEVQPRDPVVFSGAIVLMFCVAFIANYIPARRATQVDPMIALRYE
jgi:putative ABC transport system permease protein